MKRGSFIKRVYAPEHLAIYFFLVFLIAYFLLYASARLADLLTVPFANDALIILIPIFLIDGIKTVIESFKKGKFQAITEDLSKISIIIPTYNGAKFIGQTLEQVVRRCNPQHIVVASNGSTDNTCLIAQSYGVRLINIPNKIGKVDAINRALDIITTPNVLILDDDTLVGNAIIPTNILDQGYMGVAFRVLPKKLGWLSTLQLHEYRKSMDIGRGFHNTTGTVQSISGAIGLFNTQELRRQITVHSGEFSGEDLQRTLLIHLAERNKGVLMVDSTVETIVPGTIHSLFWQRVTGWYPGQIASFGIFLRLLTHKNIPFRLRFEAFYNIIFILAMEPLRILSLPIVLLSPVYFSIFYVTYIVLELIPYIILGRKEPFWVILVSPVYGLFNSICRTLALVVFIYRRLSYIIGKGKRYDDYRFVSLPVQLYSSIVVPFTLGFAMIGYCLIQIIANTYPSHLASPLASVQGIAIVAVASPTLTIQPIKRYEYIVNKNDTYWKIVNKAVTEYMEENGITLKTIEKNRLIYRVLTDLDKTALQPNQKVTVGENLITNSYNAVEHLN